MNEWIIRYICDDGLQFTILCFFYIFLLFFRSIIFLQCEISFVVNVRAQFYPVFYWNTVKLKWLLHDFYNANILEELLRILKGHNLLCFDRNALYFFTLGRNLEKIQIGVNFKFFFKEDFCFKIFTVLKTL